MLPALGQVVSTPSVSILVRAIDPLRVGLRGCEQGPGETVERGSGPTGREWPLESPDGDRPDTEPARDQLFYDCLVISDLHLGSDVCQARLLEEFLDWAVEHCRELVINGDIFDDLNFKRLTKRHFACLKVIRRNSDRDDFRLVWVRGNHDGPADIVSHIVGVEILDEYVYDNGQIQLLILHGDQFDTFITALSAG